MDTNVKFAFLLEPYHNRNSTNIMTDISLNEQYRQHPSVYKIDDNIVFYVYDHYHIPYTEWKTIVMPEINPKGYYYGLVLNPSDVTNLIDSNFNGGFTYFSSDQMSWGSNSRNWHAMCDKLLAGGLDCDISIGSGYDNTKICPWNSMNTVLWSAEHFKRQID